MDIHRPFALVSRSPEFMVAHKHGTNTSTCARFLTLIHSALPTASHTHVQTHTHTLANTHQRSPLSYMTHILQPPHSSIVPEQLGPGVSVPLQQAGGRGREEFNSRRRALKKQLPASLLD